jgi:hypothetical protein
MKIKKTIKELKKIRDNADTALEKKVVSMLIDNIEEYKTAEEFFEDIFERGLYSGIIGELVFERDAEDFFDRYYEDIMNLFCGMEIEGKNIKDDLVNGWDIKLIGAWLAFEEITARIADKLGIKI